jgi:hypothetical protein
MQSDSYVSDWNSTKLGGTLLAGVVVVGIAAALVRRARHRQNTPAAVATQAFAQTRDALSSQGLEAGRDFLVKTVVPEFKPVIQAFLDELKMLIDDAFTRAEKALKEL